MSTLSRGDSSSTYSDRGLDLVTALGPRAIFNNYRVPSHRGRPPRHVNMTSKELEEDAVCRSFFQALGIESIDDDNTKFIRSEIGKNDTHRKLANVIRNIDGTFAFPLDQEGRFQHRIENAKFWLFHSMILVDDKGLLKLNPIVRTSEDMRWLLMGLPIDQGMWDKIKNEATVFSMMMFMRSVVDENPRIRNQLFTLTESPYARRVLWARKKAQYISEFFQITILTVFWGIAYSPFFSVGLGVGFATATGYSICYLSVIAAIALV